MIRSITKKNVQHHTSLETKIVVSQIFNEHHVSLYEYNGIIALPSTYFCKFTFRFAKYDCSSLCGNFIFRKLSSGISISFLKLKIDDRD